MMLQPAATPLPPLPLPRAGERLVIASHNAGKCREIAALLAEAGLEVESAAAHNLPEPEETGDTFEANAILKAESGASRVAHLSVLADDSGLEVDALGGAPGIYSARWAGASKDFTAAMARIHDELQARGCTPEGARARFVCVLALARQGFAPRCFRGTVEGRLSFPARGDYGFGYDPIFIPEGGTLTFAQMEPAAKHRISHRAHAFALLLDALKEAA